MEWQRYEVLTDCSNSNHNHNCCCRRILRSDLTRFYYEQYYFNHFKYIDNFNPNNFKRIDYVYVVDIHNIYYVLGCLWT